jgi:predicted phage terminase large subunit-like protein
MPQPDITLTKRYQDCRSLYIKYGGKRITRLEREMHALGHTGFSRRILYSRNERGTHRPGWIERFNWNSGNVDTLAHMSAQHENVPHSDDFPAWLKTVSPELTWDWKYQKHIYKQLERVTDGTCKRLMIFMPPRHGKSELVTVRYAGWRIRRDPKMRVIVGSYNQHLANKFSRGIKNVLVASAEIETRSSRDETASPAKCTCGSNSDSRNRPEQRAQPSDRQSTQPTACPEHSPADQIPYLPLGNYKPRRINTASEWETVAGGGVKAVGVGAGVTGFGAQLIIIDDPVKSRAEAESETYRERLWNWYNSDLYTRLEPGGSIILIQTRWHEDDLAGRLIHAMEDGGEHWDVIDLPALSHGTRTLSSASAGTSEGTGGNTSVSECVSSSNSGRNTSVSECVSSSNSGGNTSVSECVSSSSSVRNTNVSECVSTSGPGDVSDPLGRSDGEPLCPERFDVPALDRIRTQLGTYDFSALYQQRPTPPGGGTFKREWFKTIVAFPPEGLKWKRGYDLAVSLHTNASYTASFRVAFDDDGNLYIDGGFRKRIEFPDQRRFIIERILAEPETEHGIELALHGRAIMQELRREPEIRSGHFRGIEVESDKLTRALTWARRAEEGKVLLVRGPWNREFLDEVCQFPHGQFDDQVDAVSLAVQMAAKPERNAWSF